MAENGNTVSAVQAALQLKGTVTTKLGALNGNPGARITYLKNLHTALGIESEKISGPLAAENKKWLKVITLDEVKELLRLQKFEDATKLIEGTKPEDAAPRLLEYKEILPDLSVEDRAGLANASLKALVALADLPINLRVQTLNKLPETRVAALIGELYMDTAKLVEMAGQMPASKLAAIATIVSETQDHVFMTVIGLLEFTALADSGKLTNILQELGNTAIPVVLPSIELGLCAQALESIENGRLAEIGRIVAENDLKLAGNIAKELTSRPLVRFISGIPVQQRLALVRTIPAKKYSLVLNEITNGDIEIFKCRK
ncbi:Uncharacterised protein [Candidatus Gugararchaeum adminiculabundum]|nr:Uncharacterised protein [Candidatus Gugararchaeum adminiculabundum]